MVKRAINHPPAKRKTAPEDCLMGTLEQWEQSVFENAHHFSVFRYPSKQSTEYKTFAEAITAANDDDRALVYAVTLQGRFFCVPRAQWTQYLARGRERS
jgi:hypothetical protein